VAAALATAAALGTGSTAVSLARTDQGFAAGRERSLTDGLLSFELPDRWTSAIRYGDCAAASCTYLLMGSFRLPSWAGDQSAEAIPRVPRGAVLVVIGDFSERLGAGWQKVSRLAPPLAPRTAVRRVRFLDRAVSISIEFGAAPTRRALREATALLAGATRAPRR
jgi:hypothetical protein